MEDTPILLHPHQDVDKDERDDSGMFADPRSKLTLMVSSIAGLAPLFFGAMHGTGFLNLSARDSVVDDVLKELLRDMAAVKFALDQKSASSCRVCV